MPGIGVWPVCGIGGHNSMAYMAGRLFIRIASAMLFAELVASLPSRIAVANTAAADGLHPVVLTLVLQRLKIVFLFIGRDHRMGTSVAGRTVQVAVAPCIAIKRLVCIYAAHTGMTRHTGGFAFPGNAPLPNAAGHLGHGPMAGSAIAVGRCVGFAPVAAGCLPRVTVVTPGLSVRMGSVDGLRQVFA